MEKGTSNPSNLTSAHSPTFLYMVYKQDAVTYRKNCILRTYLQKLMIKLEAKLTYQTVIFYYKKSKKLYYHIESPRAVHGCQLDSAEN